MTRTFLAAFRAALLICLFVPGSAGATSRIKDLANIEGVRQNQLIGYGLVVGLNGTGDTLNNIPFTKQSLTAMLERLGVNIRGQTLRTGNVAAVMVTANLPPFGTQGTRIDVTVSALGPSTSTGVTATDHLSSYLSFVNATTSTGTYNATSGIWTIGDMSASSSATLQLSGTVNADASGTILNTATVAENETCIHS